MRDFKASRSINVDTSDSRQGIISDVLFYSIGEGAIIIDERGLISRVNKIGLEILGFDEEDLLGKWYPKTLIAEEENGELIPNYELPVTESFLSGKPVYRRIYYRKKNNDRVPVALNVAPIIVQDKPIGAIQLFRDITDELQLERAKDEFISIASHQLRTPATVVKQNLGLIIEGFVKSPKEKAELLKIAYDHNNNQLDIINDLLNIARIEARKLKPDIQDIDIVVVLRKVMRSQQTDFDKRHITLGIQTDMPEVYIQADPLHMQMIFENLINNAQKYSSPYTSVMITVETGKDHVTVRVKDQGVGIAHKDMPRLFQKFSRIENVSSMASGTGLGLYWAKKLAELHKGDIHIASKLNVGTVFSVTIPKVYQ